MPVSKCAACGTEEGPFKIYGHVFHPKDSFGLCRNCWEAGLEPTKILVIDRSKEN